jgi:hypothetical protein
MNSVSKSRRARSVSLTRLHHDDGTFPAVCAPDALDPFSGFLGLAGFPHVHPLAPHIQQTLIGWGVLHNRFCRHGL